MYVYREEKVNLLEVGGSHGQDISLTGYFNNGLKFYFENRYE